jgi:hypothetical protein
MVHYQQLDVAGIAGAQLGALSYNQISKLLHVDVVSATFLTPTTVNGNVKAAVH